ncbi:GNAT family N-acetyltransferase [Candidatus Woesearchaeota archaeon]|nr:GNAT family N-acetyltransferase [Candidatus Woesearchaeota archaeon]
METRNATDADIDGIAACLRSGLNMTTDAEAIRAVTDEMRSGFRFIVADDAGRIVGVTSWFVHGRPRHGLVELDHIVVLPETRGKGVAKRLYDALKKEATAWFESHGGKLRKLFLLTHHDNERAHAFYEKMGMHHECTLPKHFYPDKDEWVMSEYFD